MGKRLFDSKIAIVSGGSSGIGRATAIALGREGASVVVIGQRENKLQEVVEQVGRAGGSAVSLAGDLKEDRTISRAIDLTLKKFGRPHIIINNAGISHIGNVVDTSLKDWDNVLNVNLRAAFLFLKESVQVMEDGGAVITVSSPAGSRPWLGSVAYNVSKSGLNMLSQLLALELAPRQIRVNVVSPAIILGTDIVDKAVSGLTENEIIKQREGFKQMVQSGTPIGRTGNADEVAELILYLASDKAGYITGGIFPIDGGRVLTTPKR